MRIIRRTALFLVLAAGFGVSGCNVDQSGLTSAGAGGTRGGLAGSNGAGTTGSAGSVSATGAGGSAIPSPGTAGTGDAAGASGGAGTTGSGGTEHTGLAGASGTAGGTGAAGISGGAGRPGAAGVVGPGTAGIAGGGTTGSAGAAGSAGTIGTAGNTGSAGAPGGAAGTSTGGRGGAGGRVATCGPANCPTGCCQDNVCVTMPTDKACGTAGAACQTCGTCFRCSTKRTCEADPKVTWAISCQSATIQPTRPNGSAWDPPGNNIGSSSKPDPYCTLWSSDGADGSTAAITDTLTPTWPAAGNLTSTSRGVSTTVLLDGGWTISVFDLDGSGPLSSSETICTTTPSVSSADLRSGGVTVSDVGSCSDIVLGFTCIP